VVINVEVPPGPTRFTQRAGRVARLGQSRTVHVFTLVHAQGLEEPVLARFEDRRAAINDALATTHAPQRAVVEGWHGVAVREAARLQSVRRLVRRMPTDGRDAVHGRVPCALWTKPLASTHWRLVISATARDAAGRLVETMVLGVTFVWRSAPPRDWRACRRFLAALLQHVEQIGVFTARAAVLDGERSQASTALLARAEALLARASGSRGRHQASLFDERAERAAARAIHRAGEAASWWRVRVTRLQAGQQPCRVDEPVLRAAYTVGEAGAQGEPRC
jgi:hypothetical protein